MYAGTRVSRWPPIDSFYNCRQVRVIDVAPDDGELPAASAVNLCVNLFSRSPRTMEERTLYILYARAVPFTRREIIETHHTTIIIIITIIKPC